MGADYYLMLKETMLQPLIEAIQDECLDIVDDEEVTAKKLACDCMDIAGRLQVNKVVEYWLHIGSKDYQVKVNNNYGGFVSVSDSCNTGVSRTLYYPYYEDEDGNAFAGLMSLAQMINEAWYLCDNN